jgi:hypothetical protein
MPRAGRPSGLGGFQAGPSCWNLGFSKISLRAPCGGTTRIGCGGAPANGAAVGTWRPAHTATRSDTLLTGPSIGLLPQPISPASSSAVKPAYVTHRMSIADLTAAPRTQQLGTFEDLIVDRYVSWPARRALAAAAQRRPGSRWARHSPRAVADQRRPGLPPHVFTATEPMPTEIQPVARTSRAA